MKIVGFEADGGLHLGVLEGDELVDLQAIDKTIPGDLGEVLRRHNGDLSSLRDAAKRAPSTARRPLKGLKFGGWPASYPVLTSLAGRAGIRFVAHIVWRNRDERSQFLWL